MESLNKLPENLEAAMPAQIKLVRSFYFSQKKEGESCKTKMKNKNSAKS